MPPRRPPDFPVLETERLILRAVAPADAPAYRALLSQEEVTRFSNIVDSPSPAQARAMVKAMGEKLAKGSGCAWAIEARGAGAFVGMVRFNYINAAWKAGGVGYEIDPRFWGRGLMSEALRAVVTQGHGPFGLNRIEAWTVPGNTASDRVLEKNGFRYEGTHRQQAWFKGAFHDFRIFARLAADPLP